MPKKCYKTEFFSNNHLQISEKSVPLQRVFHSIRFKVNKGWSTAVLLFFLPNLNISSIKQHNPKEKPLKPLIDKPKIRTFAESIEIT